MQNLFVWYCWGNELDGLDYMDDDIKLPEGAGERLPSAYTTFGLSADLDQFFVMYLEQLPEVQQVAARVLPRDVLVARYEDAYVDWMNGVYAQIPRGWED